MASMNKNHYRKVCAFLSHSNIEQTAIITGFQKRAPKKITATFFLLSFFITLSRKSYSLREWATELSILSGSSVSFQSIAKRLQCRHLEFVKTMCILAIEEHFAKKVVFAHCAYFSFFNKVLIEDSTCIQLNKSLFEHYPGGRNQHKRSTIAKIQLSFDLKTHGVDHIEISSYNKNDLTYAPSILKRIEPNDLIIRDLGYFVCKVFNQIIKKGAYFISRLSTIPLVYNQQDGTAIDLVKQLQKMDKRGIISYTHEVQIGTNDRVPARLIAVKLSKYETLKRRRAASKRRTVSQKSYYLMSWSMFITNVPISIMTDEQITKTYGLRWHIEIIFKNLKSNFGIHKIMNSCKGPNPIKPEILMYLSLLFIIMIYSKKLRDYHQIIYEKYGRHLSPNRFAKFLCNHFLTVFEAPEEAVRLLMQAKCCYDLRKDRMNTFEKLI